jgi:hypothetical protein
MRAHGLGMVLALLLSGCGAFSGGGPGQGNSYIGSWQYFSGIESQTCDDGTSPSQSLQGNALTIGAGSANSELLVQEGPCQVIFIIGAEGASLAREQECPVSGSGQDSNGPFTFSGSIRVTQGALRYNSDTDLRIAQSDLRILQYSTGKRLRCEVSTNGTLERLTGR